MFNSATVYYKASSSPLPVAWQPGPALASSGQQFVAMAAGSALQSASQLWACQPKQLSLASQHMWCANPDSLPAFSSPFNAAVHLRVPVAGHVAPAPAAHQPAAGKGLLFNGPVCGVPAHACDGHQEGCPDEACAGCRMQRVQQSVRAIQPEIRPHVGFTHSRYGDCPFLQEFSDFLTKPEAVKMF